MLFINGTAVVNNNAYQGITTRTGTYTAATAGLYPIEIAYYQGGGGNGLFASADANASGSDYLVNGAGVDQILSGGNWNYGNALNVTGASTLSAPGAGKFRQLFLERHAARQRQRGWIVVQRQHAAERQSGVEHRYGARA